MLKFSPIMLKIMLTLLHCAQHYAHLQCKKGYYQTVAYKFKGNGEGTSPLQVNSCSLGK